MDGPIDSAAACQVSVRRVDDRVDFLVGDVALHQPNPARAEVNQHASSEADLDCSAISQPVAALSVFPCSSIVRICATPLALARFRSMYWNTSSETNSLPAPAPP